MDSLSSDSPARKSSSTLTSTQFAVEREKVISNLTRARHAGNPATLTLDQWLQILDDYEWKCAYCRRLPYQVLEHSRPLIAGGGTTAENCVPACQPCNICKKLQIAIYDDATESFRFFPIPPDSIKNSPALNSIHHRRSHRHKFSPLPLMTSKPVSFITETYGEWLTEDQVLEKLAKVSRCRETNIEVLTYMVRRGTLHSIPTAHGVMYRIKKL